VFCVSIIISKSRIPVSESLLVSNENMEIHKTVYKIIPVWINFDDIYLTYPIQVKIS